MKHIWTNFTYSVSLQSTNDCTCSGNRPTVPAENVLSLCLVNSKRTFTLQPVYYSTLIKYYLQLFLIKIDTYFFRKCFVPQTPYRGFELDPTGGLRSPRPSNLGHPSHKFPAPPLFEGTEWCLCTVLVQTFLNALRSLDGDVEVLIILRKSLIIKCCLLNVRMSRLRKCVIFTLKF